MGTIRQRPATRSLTNTGSDSGPSPTTATAANSFAILQQQQQQDPMNASHLSFHIQSATASSTASLLTTERRRVENSSSNSDNRNLCCLGGVNTVTGILGSPSTSTSNSMTTPASLTPSQRAMVQAQLNPQKVPPNVVMFVTASCHHQHRHHNILRNQYQTQMQTHAGPSSSLVVSDWSMGSPVHTPLSSSSSAAVALVSSLESGALSLSLCRHHRMVNSMTRSPPLSAPPSTTVAMSSRQKVY